MHLKKILEEKINKLGIGRQVTASQVCDAYNKIIVEMFGKDILKDTEAISLKKGVLKVRVSSSALSQEIQGRSREIIQKINKIISKKAVERIRFG